MRSFVRVVSVVAVVLLLGVIVSGCGKDVDKKAHHKTTGPVAKTEIAQKTCPVMGGPINKDLYADHLGRRVYFCCPACVDTFKRDPEKYLGKVDAEIKKVRDAAAKAAGTKADE